MEEVWKKKLTKVSYDQRQEKKLQQQEAKDIEANLMEVRKIMKRKAREMEMKKK